MLNTCQLSSKYVVAIYVKNKTAMKWIPDGLGEAGSQMSSKHRLRFIFIYFIYLFTLQYCIGFAVHWHESTTGVHAFPNMKPPILVFWMLSFKPTFSLSSLPLIKRLFSSFSLSAIRIVLSAYLRLLLFLLAILIPVCDSSSRAFHMMYSVPPRKPPIERMCVSLMVMESWRQPKHPSWGNK